MFEGSYDRASSSGSSGAAGRDLTRHVADRKTSSQDDVNQAVTREYRVQNFNVGSPAVQRVWDQSEIYSKVNDRANARVMKTRRSRLDGCKPRSTAA